MSAWIIITPQHLTDYLVAAQVSALRTAALGAGQTDRFTAVMQDRCSYLRNRLSKRVRISATPLSVPPELKSQACWLIIEALQVSLPALKLDDDQVRVVQRAYKDLDIAGTDELPVSTPDDPATPAVQSGGAAQVASSSRRQATRASLDRI